LSAAAAADWVWDPESGWLDTSEPVTDSDRGLYRHARALFVRGEYAAAAEAFAQVQAGFPDSALIPKARFGLARCLARLGDTRRAVALCKDLLEAGADDAAGIVSFMLDLLEEVSRSSPLSAGHDLWRVAQRAPTPDLRYRAYFAAGRAFFRAGDYDLARFAFDEAADVAKRRSEAEFRSAVCDLAASREGSHDEARLRRALEVFERLERREGEEAEIAAQYARALRRVLDQADPDRRRIYYAATYLPEKRYDEALAILRPAARRYKGSDAGEAARFYEAECLFLQGRYWKAFKAYEKFVEEYPQSERLSEAAAREFEIGEALLEAGALRKAAAVFEAAASNDPTGPLADDAELELGRVRLRQGRYEEASASFQAVRDQYPNSERAQEALFLAGVADLKSAGQGSDNAEEVLERASAAFEGYLRAQPQGEYAERSAELLRQCRERLAAVRLRIASFYERRGELRAAALYCRGILEEYPETRAAREAQARLAEFRERGVSPP